MLRPIPAVRNSHPHSKPAVLLRVWPLQAARGAVGPATALRIAHAASGKIFTDCDAPGPGRGGGRSIHANTAPFGADEETLARIAGMRRIPHRETQQESLVEFAVASSTIHIPGVTCLCACVCGVCVCVCVELFLKGMNSSLQAGSEPSIIHSPTKKVIEAL